MAHPEQYTFFETVTRHLSENFSGKKVLEVGSYDITGSIRPLFAGSDYTGVDLSEGPGVDVVCEGNKLDHPDGTYDVTVSGECFEHNPYWAETLTNMYRMTKSGGLLIFSCATTGRFEHGTKRTSPMSPGSQSIGWDYYLNLTERDVRRAVDIDRMFPQYFFDKNTDSCDLYFIGQKPGAGPIFPFDAATLKEQCASAQAALKQRRIAESKARPSTVSAPWRLLGRLSLLPVKAARGLPDRQYQTFVINYERIMNAVKAPFRKLA